MQAQHTARFGSVAAGFAEGPLHDRFLASRYFFVPARESHQGVAAPLIKRSRSSAARTGWFVNSNKNKVRYADIYKEAARPSINHPVCAANDASRHLLIAQPPLEKEGTQVYPF